MPLGMEVGLGSCRIVLDGNPALPQKGHGPQFLAQPDDRMDQDATCYGGGLGPGNIMLDRWQQTWAEKWGSVLCLFGGRGAEFSSNILSRPPSLPSGILIHPTVWPQYTNVTDRHTGQRSIA